MKYIEYSHLKDFVHKVFLTVGLDSFSAAAVTEGLTETSLRGVDSHGVRLVPHYVRSALSGRKNPKPKFEVHHKYPTIALLNADNAFGHAAGMFAMDECMKMADQFGTGIVGVANSSHPGAMASFALKAARQGHIAFAFTHADALTLTHGGTRPFFGTNPVCFAAPRQGSEPFCLDMATSTASWNKVLLARANNQILDQDIAADASGELTHDPNAAVAVLPSGTYKGVGLAAMVEVLCSLFTGMNFGRNILSMYKTPMEKTRNLGQFYMAFKADGCIDQNSFLQNMMKMTEEFQAEPTKPGQKVMLPNDREIIESIKRRETGIPIDDASALEFERLAREYNLKLKFLS